MGWFRRNQADEEITKLRGQLQECERLLLNYAAIDDRLRKLQRIYSTLSNINQIIVRAKTRDSLYAEICRSVVTHNKFVLCWIGEIDQLSSTYKLDVASAYGRTEYLKGVEITTNKQSPTGRGPTGVALRDDKLVYINDYFSDPTTLIWKEQAEKHGLRSAAAIPLHKYGAVIGSITLYADEVNFFDESQTSLLQEMADDVSFALESFDTKVRHKEAEAARAHAVERLKKTLQDMIEMAAMVIEKRDPYTAGHQKRVALLSVEIGRELNLSAEQNEGLYHGALIHDIGKIAVPAEILSRPGALTFLEREIIKTHTQVGYDMVKNIDFPWPIKDIIIQHHERLDGSGYPNGLIGDQIILEAHIVIVADVVEAMASHRPYRAALGLETAIDEITKNRGRLYSEKVVDGCIAVIQRLGALPS